MTVAAAEALGSRTSTDGGSAASSLAVPGSRAATYTARVVNSAAEINRADWQQVCTGTTAPVFMDPRFVEAVEHALRPACRFWFVIVYAGKEPVACAGLTAMTVDFTDFGDRRITWLVKYNPLLRALPKHEDAVLQSAGISRRQKHRVCAGGGQRAGIDPA